jgi:hypothetical protein
MLRDPGAGLVRRAEHRVTELLRGVHDRTDLFDLVRSEPLRVDPIELVRLDAPHAVAHVLQAVREIHDSPLTEQDRIIEFLLEGLPQLESVLIDRGALIPQIVGPDDRRVAGHVPTR